MADLAMPNPSEPVADGECPNCRARVRMYATREWYRLFARLVQLVNEGL